MAPVCIMNCNSRCCWIAPYESTAGSHINSCATVWPCTDRGRVTPGASADLPLVDGDPTTNISDTLSIRGVWRQGVQLKR